MILKELLLRGFERDELKQPDDEICQICKKDQDYMMKCMVCKKLFHPQCAGRKLLAKTNTWICKQCKN